MGRIPDRLSLLGGVACEFFQTEWLLSGLILELLGSIGINKDTQGPGVLSLFCFLFFCCFSWQVLLPTYYILLLDFPIFSWEHDRGKIRGFIHVDCWVIISWKLFRNWLMHICIPKTRIPRNSNISVAWIYVLVFCCELIPYLSWSLAAIGNGRRKVRSFLVAQIIYSLIQ